MGKLRDGEQVYEGEHAGIVDAELWERANAAVNRWRGLARVERRHCCESRPAAGAARISGQPAMPRLSRLLALALKMEQMIQEGTAKNYSELARLGQVSTARISQVMNLLHLAPDIQEEILLANRPQDGLRESTVRKLSGVILWSEQRARWQELVATASVQKHPELRSCC
jgi:hypothetical protein